ncbi:hypothetical protein B0T19DRAFT_442720 [Cercophora scortea]|uniref:Uncharacterized protein n=1 Tax=Cercophora scortea TaxID=314031 RepID=A0AAE0M9U1_9PEZI|nr:hypothetical protein B0T19DRAFT_442720 [Cercophora scortea]
MAAADTSFRYSTDAVASSETARVFPWEQPIPVNTFWGSFDYPTARAFLDNIPDGALGLDPASTADHTTKLQIILRLLRQRITMEETVLSPQPLHDADYHLWYQRTQSLYILENALDLPEAGQTIQKLVAGAVESDVRPKHLLGEYLVKTGNYKEAEEAARPVAAAALGEGETKRAETEGLLSEVREIVEGLERDGGDFGVYQQEERKLTAELLAALEKY